MNRPTHIVGGAVAGGLGYYFTCRLLGIEPNWGAAFLFAGAGAGVACLPDFLGPAIHPNHRAFFHSLLLNGTLVVGMRRLWLNEHLSPQQKILWTTLSLAWLSHPFLDARTPKGLPLV